MWIEIPRKSHGERHGESSPHGGCGLKFKKQFDSDDGQLSSPPRGMWIEMSASIGINELRLGHPPHGGCGLKSPRSAIFITLTYGHPPHGGCGLKFKKQFESDDGQFVIPPTGDVD